jgi:Protein of unknown function (DUF2911)
MKINKAYIALGLIIAFTLFVELAAHADEFNQATTLTFNEPIQIPGQTLPAGTYLFRLANADSDLNIVQVLNSDGTVLYATLQTIATERQEPTGHTAITLAEQASGKADALLKWFYPGRVIGNEFVYSNQEEKELAQDRQQTIVGNHPNSDGTGTGD